MPAHRHALVLGGARSGKSLFAERLALEWPGPVVYVATATPVDEEMAERIAHHRARRPPEWRTLELTTEIAIHVPSDTGSLVIEDLTLLLSNHMQVDTATAESLTVREIEDLLKLHMNVVLVSNEVGMGLVPETPLGRNFRDALGRVNQRAAAMCTEVYFVVAGLPFRIK